MQSHAILSFIRIRLESLIWSVEYHSSDMDALGVVLRSSKRTKEAAQFRIRNLFVRRECPYLLSEPRMGGREAFSFSHMQTVFLARFSRHMAKTSVHQRIVSRRLFYSAFKI